MVYQIRALWSDMLRARSRWPRLAGTLDSSHVAGMLINCFLSLGMGLTNYLVPGSDIDLLVSTLERQDINFLFAVPPILQRLVAHDRWVGLALPSLQHVVVGAARCTPELQQAVTRKMARGGFCQQGWGMTELTFLATMPVPGNLGPWESVGKLLDGNKIKVCADDGSEVQVGAQGEIYISGEYCTSSYMQEASPIF
jgi:acyl-coenzyme A synthetase/AMP-(fatty) acid ligase